MNAENFASNYFELWMTTDAARRRELAVEVFTEDAIHSAAPANVVFKGRDAIEQNITRVNTDNIQKARLQFRTGAVRGNSNAVQIEWAVATPDGKVVGTGRDFLLLNDFGQATALYMFNA